MDLDYFVKYFENIGFWGGINYYWNMYWNWEFILEFIGVIIDILVMFFVGEKDFVIVGVIEE